MVAVTEVEPLEGYRVNLRFDDGSERVVDLSDALWGQMGEPLRDPDYFRLRPRPRRPSWRLRAGPRPRPRPRLGHEQGAHLLTEPRLARLVARKQASA